MILASQQSMPRSTPMEVLESFHVLPGQKIAEMSSNLVLGMGVYERHGYVHASLVGKVEHKGNVGDKVSISVVPIQRSTSQTIVPSVGQEVLCRVLRLSSKYAAVDILAVGEVGSDCSQVLMEPIRGTIRLQDIVDIEEKDVPLIQLAFRPGDIVRSRVIGIGDPSAGLLLSTGLSAEYGVVFAKSAAAAAPLLPFSWNEMVCSQSGVKERRKCAKPRSNQQQ